MLLAPMGPEGWVSLNYHSSASTPPVDPAGRHQWRSSRITNHPSPLLNPLERIDGVRRLWLFVAPHRGEGGGRGEVAAGTRDLSGQSVEQCKSTRGNSGQ